MNKGRNIKVTVPISLHEKIKEIADDSMGRMTQGNVIVALMLKGLSVYSDKLDKTNSSTEPDDVATGD